MLGAPCSPCCDSCTDERVYELWESLQTRSYKVTVGGTVPAQDACMTSQGFSSNAVAGATATQPSSWAWQYHKQLASVAGEHEMALNFEPETWLGGGVQNDPGTVWLPDIQQGRVSLVSKTDDYTVRLVLDVSRQSATGQVWPGAKCPVTSQLWVVCRLRSAYSEPGQPVSPSIQSSSVTKTATQPLNNAPITKTIVTTSPPYSQFIGTGLGTFRDPQRNQYAAVDYSGYWDFVDKPSSLSWGVVTHSYRHLFSEWSSDGSDVVSVQFLPVINQLVPQNVWKPGDDGGIWVKSLSPGDLEYWLNEANNFYRGPAFRAEYSTADKHYTMTSITSAMTASVQSLPEPSP